eukprot:CAMPEP_0194505098 /NCGR_PEP_ID=MMETSP0253-20130528/31159_1 /TAXON_ID=2966 /ORGANISM="Noctiluca scintillans" /LENGTH=210 /DNA_ID=CAMNT_0039347593 /DNA_START=15 /DNA_END=644 /DNA_ORIENTATION=+
MKTRREIREDTVHDHPIAHLARVEGDDSSCPQTRDAVSTRDISEREAAEQLEVARRKIESLEQCLGTKREQSRSFAKGLVHWMQETEAKLQDEMNQAKLLQDQLGVASRRLAHAGQLLVDERERTASAAADRDISSQQLVSARTVLESLRRAHACRVEQQDCHIQGLERQVMDLHFRLDDSATSNGEVKCTVASSRNAKERAMLAESGAH